MNLRKKSTREEFEPALAQCKPEDFDVHTEFHRLTPSSGSNGYARPRRSFTSSKAKQILAVETDSCRAHLPPTSKTTARQTILSRAREGGTLPPMRARKASAAQGVVECTRITNKYVIMSGAQFIHELEAMSKSERESIFASLVENQEWREDLFDLMTMADRRNEPVRSIDEVFSDLKIDA